MTEPDENIPDSDKIGIYRLLDANFNRSFEAFRVVEDVVRFSYDNIMITEKIKELRHALKAVAVAVGREMIIYRDVLSDVGTRTTDPDEEKRLDQVDLLFVNFGRLKEALRTIEEALKTVLTEAAQATRKIRYQVYEIEKRAVTLVTPKPRLAHCGLYVIVGNKPDGKSPVSAAREAAKAGADVIQLRVKNIPDFELLKLARGIREITAREKCLFVVNDRVDVAILAQADGVHVGQDDLPVEEARKLLGSKKILGVSTHDPEEARKAVEGGADYVAAGAMFETETKADASVSGPELAQQVAETVNEVPVFAIGGINLGNIHQLLKAGIKRVAISSAITDADSVQVATEKFKKILSEAGES